jgi:hypothetical protein
LARDKAVSAARKWRSQPNPCSAWAHASEGGGAINGEWPCVVTTLPASGADILQGDQQTLGAGAAQRKEYSLGNGERTPKTRKRGSGRKAQQTDFDEGCRLGTQMHLSYRPLRRAPAGPVLSNRMLRPARLRNTLNPRSHLL